MSRCRHIGIAGPILTAELADFLEGDLDNAPSGMGGTPLCTLVRAFLERDYQVTVVSLDPYVTEPLTLRGARLTVRYGPYRRMHRMRDGMRAERSVVMELLKDSRPSLVNAHWAYEYALGALASGYPTLVTVHDWGPAILRHAPTPYWAASQLLYLAAVRGAHALSTVSPYVAGKLRRLTARPVAVIPNAVPHNGFAAEPRTHPHGAPVIASLNPGFTALKNVSALLQAFPFVKQELPACRLVLAGPEFGIDEAAEHWARAHRLESGVEFAGALDSAAVVDLLDRADLLVHPSLEESFGMTLIEAMARRTPVVGGRRSGAVPWVLDGGTAGVLTEVQAPLDIAASIIAVLSDRSLWRGYSEAGYRRARQHFASRRVAEEYLDAYERLLGPGG
jgi:L-malate glycosyltransferase